MFFFFITINFVYYTGSFQYDMYNQNGVFFNSVDSVAIRRKKTNAVVLFLLEYFENEHYLVSGWLPGIIYILL